VYISSTAKNSIQKETPSNPVARLDKKLATGEVPEDLYILPGERPEVVEGKPEGYGLPVNFRSGAVKEARTRARISTAVLAPLMATPGALLGTMAFPNAPLVGAAVGAGIGVAMALDSASEFTGSVKISDGGEQSRRTWYGEPENFERTPAELRTIFHSTGVLGDRVDMVPFDLKGVADVQLLNRLDEQRESLKSLAGQRRLLGDLRGKTRYGKPALQLLEANQAKELLGRGRSVHLIDVLDLQKVEHRLDTEANSGIHHKKSLKSYRYTQDRIEYRLREISRPEDLSTVEDGRGLPDSMLGVPSGEQTFSQTVYQKQESAGRTIGDKKDQSFQQLKEVLTESGKSVNAGHQLGSAVGRMVHPSTRGYTITGAVLGMVAGAAIGGVEPAVGLTLGGFAGHFVGRQAVARTSEGTEMSSVGRKLVTGLGTAAGLGIGILAASADPRSAVVACGTIGLLGGMSTGVLIGRGKGELGKNIAMTGACVGGLAGVGLAALGGGPVASVIVGALGAAAGGVFGAVATRGK
jgi:hypothetical protein